VARVIDADVVRHVARLARLGLDPDEVETMRRELSGILEHVDRVQELDLADVPPTTHVIHLANVLRADEPAESLPPELALREAPRTADQGFSVGRMG
jgi:aspartyl-tRNA(Asn)/glutamyl-tRNA(Gln) amidotransferase subunit C